MLDHWVDKLKKLNDKLNSMMQKKNVDLEKVKLNDKEKEKDKNKEM